MAARRALSSAVHELRLAFCQTSEGSKGLRDFVSANYSALKADNPRLPILVREAAGAEARVAARFAKGAEQALSVEGMSAKEVEGVLQQLAKQ